MLSQAAVTKALRDNQAMATRTKDSNAPVTALYFYGVSRGGAPRLRSLRGIHAIRLVENRASRGVVGLYRRVARGDYGERLERNMENLEWLASASVHHQRVVGSI